MLAAAVGRRIGGNSVRPPARGFSKLSCGLVGLPNVGKSSIFNALTSSEMAASENYPFCTIDPNVATVMVPDSRLGQLRAVAGSERTVPTALEFIDIAGLVRGASDGKGMGNKFLSNVRSTSAIIHVLRCFEDDDVIHVRDGEGEGPGEDAGGVRVLDPVEDAAVIETELVLADLQSAEAQLAKASKGKGKGKVGGPDGAVALGFLEGVVEALGAGVPASTWLEESREGGEAALSAGERAAWQSLALITQKPVVLLCNVDEAGAGGEGNALYRAVRDWAAAERPSWPVVKMCASLEEEVAGIADEAERRELLTSMGLSASALEEVHRAAMAQLRRRVFFTVGPQETRAWLIRAGALAPEAAGVIHTDFEKKFIKADVIAFDDYTSLGGEKAAREAGKLRSEGREYEVRDGDVIVFKHGG